MQIRINGSANLSQIRAEFAALEAQVAGLNATMAKGAKMPALNPKGHVQYANAIQSGSQAYRNSLASSGAFRVEQMKLSTATDHYTDLLQRQKLSFREVFGAKNKGLMRSIYQEQLKMRDLQARPIGKTGMFDISIPQAFRKELDTTLSRMNMLGTQFKSAGTHMVNFGKNTQWAGRQLTVGLTMPVVALGAAAAVMAYKVDQQMTRVRKVYNTTSDQSSKNVRDMAAVQKEFADLNRDSWNTVTEATQKYASSATDTLGVQAELAAAGYTGQKLQKSTTQVMKSAMLGEIDYQTATTATISLQQTLHQTNKDVADSWNYMNSVENATTLQQKDFATAIPIALGPLKQMGGTLQDVGTLMTAMVSKGIQVGKAANAIKALPQRLSNPAKSTQELFKQMTGQDIMELNKKNPDNVIAFLTDIENATKNLDTLSKRRVLAKLFGSYQLSTMSAMLGGMNDLQKGIGQTTQAFEIGQQSTKQWAQVSAQETKQMQESVSFQFKKMINEVKNASVEFGRPFLEIGTAIGTTIAKAMEGFNKMPHLLKILAAVPIALAAIAGPVLMLIGLFGNLAGNALRGVGSIMSLGKSFVLMTKEQRAMAAAHRDAQVEMQAYIGATTTEAEMLGLLAKAESEASAAAMERMLIENGTNEEKINAALGQRVGLTSELVVEEKALSVALRDEAAAAKLAAANLRAARDVAVTRGNFAAADVLGVRATAKSNQARSASVRGNNAAAAEANATAAATEKAAASTTVLATKVDESKRSMAGAALAGGAMAASMGLMMFTSNKVAQSVGMWLMLSSMAIPAIKAANAAVRAMWASERLAAAGAALLNLTWGKVAVGIRAAGIAIKTAMGPIGWILLGVTAIATVAFKIWQHNKKITAEHNKQSDVLSKQHHTLDSMLDISQKMSRLKPAAVGPEMAQGKSVVDMADTLNKSKSGKEQVKTYLAGDDFERGTQRLQVYMDTLNAVGGTADKAQAAVQALMIAAGRSVTTAQTTSRNIFNAFGDALSPQELASQWGNQMRAAVDETKDAATQTGKNLAVHIEDAMAKGGPGAATTYIEEVKKQLDSKYQDAFSSLGDQSKKYFKGLGIDSGSEFMQAWRDTQSKTDDQLMKKYNLSDYLDVSQFRSQMGVAYSEISPQLDNINAMEKAIVETIGQRLGAGKEVTTIQQLQLSYAMQLQALGQEDVKNARLHANQIYQQALAAHSLGKTAEGLKGTYEGISDATRLTMAQQAAGKADLPVVNDLLQQELILAHAQSGTWKDTSSTLDKIIPQLKGMNAIMAEANKITKAQALSIQKDSMSGVTDDIANALQSGFEAQQKSAQDSLQSTWDKRLKINDRNAERETRALESKWDKLNDRTDTKWKNLHDAADAKWQRRKDAMTTYWDTRIENVDKAIQAEEDADAIRQKIFEAEKTRIERLSQMANTNIDFNVALNSGNLDEAAKIRNDMQAQTADWALSDAGTAGSDAKDKRVKALNDQKDALDKQKDAALKNLDILEKANQDSLDKREKQEKDSLKRQEGREKRHLDRMQQVRADNLKLQEDRANAALASRQTRETAAFNDRITLFKSYIARDQADLERWMKEVGVSYNGFGKDVKGKGEQWSTWFRDSMVKHMREAGSAVKSDNMWAAMGQQARKDMFNAMGFKGIKEFAAFIKSGTLPANYGNRDLTSKKVANSPVGPVNTLMAHHSGGEVGVAAGSRVGVARSLKGLHPSETLINAQKGEFVVNRRAAKEHKPLLEAINKGSLDSRNNIGYGTGGGVDLGGIGMGIAATMLVKGITSAMMRKTSEALSSISGDVGAGASYAAGKAGHFGSRDFDAEQLGNAAIIADVGSGMGMSKRDLEIGIMTAITESSLRNLKFGDRDSQGLFQQRPSQGWGTVEQITNPRYAANAFFSHLKAVSNRNDMSPWMAAQTVQRSGTPDGSNYKQYWDEAMAIFTGGITAAGGGFIAGKGGYRRASVPGKGWSNSHDYRNGLGSPLFAAADGTVIESRAITGSGTPGNGLYSTPYSSYGETIVLRTSDGDRIRYAHLNPGARFVSVGDRVAGGALIGRSGQTGNSTGPHTHFEINSQEIAREWFKSHGIGLDTGGYTTSDGMANLHKDEVVIDPARTNALYQGLDSFNAVMDSVKNVGNGTGGDTGSSTDFGSSRITGVGDQSEFATTDTNLRDHPPIPPAALTATTGTKPDTGKAFGLRTGTFNLLNKNSASEQIHDLRQLVTKADILSLSEYNHGGKVGEWFDKIGWRAYSGGHETALAWNKKVIGGIDLNSDPINPKNAGPSGLQHRFAAWGLFRDKKSGRYFYQASIHTVPKRGPGHTAGTVKQRNKIQVEQAQHIQKLYDNLRKTGRPVIFGGDINSIIAGMLKGDRHAAGNNTFQMFGNMNAGAAKGSTDKTGWNSDHMAVYAKYAVPGLKTGGYTMSDGLANLHENELVVDPARTKLLLEGIDNFASGTNATYNVHMNVNGDTNADEIVNKTITALKRMESRKPQSRRG